MLGGPEGQKPRSNTQGVPCGLRGGWPWGSASARLNALPLTNIHIKGRPGGSTFTQSGVALVTCWHANCPLRLQLAARGYIILAFISKKKKNHKMGCGGKGLSQSGIFNLVTD